MSKNLYLVEFGEPDASTYNFGTSQNIKPIYVCADTYDQANRKAMAYAENVPSDKTSILTSDGSLNLTEDKPINIKLIKQISDNLIF